MKIIGRRADKNAYLIYFYISARELLLEALAAALILQRYEASKLFGARWRSVASL
jgi:hypothetical protein